jgi:4-hydroxybenzoate polyprenyltransferase
MRNAINAVNDAEDWEIDQEQERKEMTWEER